MFDVFEHLTNPLATMDELFSRLRPGGLLCVVTGIADNWLFQMTGARYNYVCMPEHVCFLTEKFAAFLGKRYKSEFRISTLSRGRGDLRSSARAVAINTINLPMCFLKSKAHISKWYSSSRLKVLSSKGIIPMWASDDHALFVLHKTAASSAGGEFVSR